MKIKNSTLTLFAVALLGATTFLGGCASTGMERSAKASNSIKDVDSEIRKFIVQIDATGNALDSLIRAGRTELKKPFDNYTEKLEALDSEGKRVIRRMDEMKANSKEYFAEWEKQGESFANPEIRNLSEERRAKLAEIYAQVPAAGAGIKGTYLAYLKDLKEIQLYLSNDLTPTGIEGITPVAQQSVQDLDALKSSLRPVIYALDEIKAELYSGKK